MKNLFYFALKSTYALVARRFCAILALRGVLPLSRWGFEFGVLGTGNGNGSIVYPLYHAACEPARGEEVLGLHTYSHIT
jgi:hypothetical protein